MTDLEATLAAIIENPADDFPRLCYADLLDEQGQGERAELIRGQIEYELNGKRMEEVRGCTCRRHVELMEAERCEWCRLDHKREAWRQRERELFHCLYNDDLPGPFVPSLDFSIGRDAPHAHYRRGFAEKLTLSWHDWHTHADMLTAQHPIREVWLTEWPETELQENQENRSYFLRLKDSAFYLELGARSVENFQGEEAARFGSACIQRLLKMEWPKISFELPQYGPSVLAGLHPGQLVYFDEHGGVHPSQP